MRTGYLLLILTVAAALPLSAADYTTPRALAIGDTYVLNVDGYTGDEATTEPKTDANNGLNGDNPYYQRTNVARAHDGGNGPYWYTSSYQNAGEPDPAGNQWVDYKPPLTILGPGRYRINAQYRVSDSRATYPALYIVTHDGGTTTIEQSQRVGTGYVSFDLGEFDLGSTGYVRVKDTGSQSITFNRMRFTYISSAAPDTEAPTVPTNVQTSVLSSTSVRITWNASTDNIGVTGYRIYRNGVSAGTSATNSYTDTGLQPNTAYSYTVAAYDAAGNNSAQSSPPASVTTPAADTQPPSVPTGLQALPISSAAIQLTWNASTDNVVVAGYRVFRDGGQIANVATTTYTDSGLSPNTTYLYSVSAYDGDGNNSAQSSPAVPGTTQQQVAPAFCSVDLNSNDVNNMLSRVSVADGYTSVTTAGGLECRKPLSTTATYMYFAVDNTFLYDTDATTYLEVCYFDDKDSSVVMIAEYDSAYGTDEYGAGGAYKQAGGVALSNTGKWKTATWTLPRSRFAGRQNSGADFRVYIGNSGDVKIDSVRLCQVAFGQHNGAEKDFGASEQYLGISHPQPADGDTVALDYAGRSCRRASATGDNYFYLNVSDAVMYDGSPSTVYLEVVYYDSPGGVIRPHYDSTEGAYTMASQVTFAGSGTWQEAVWELPNAVFAGNQTGSADLRLYVGTAQNVYIDRVIVSRNEFVADTEAPSVPTGVQATGLSPTSISVTWTSSTDNVGVAGYKIYRDGNHVGNSVSASYTDTGLQPVTSYSYTVSAHDASGNYSAESSPPVSGSTLPDTQPPSITQHPTPAQVCLNETAQFTVTATGSGTLSYQWRKNGSDLSNGGHYSGVTTPTLTVSSAAEADEGAYRCVVTNAYGNVTSTEAALTVNDCSSPLVVSSDGHYFEFRGNRVLLIGDSVTQGWQECGTNFDQNAYVDALAARGINMLMLWSYIGITDQVGDTRIGYNAPEIWPWVKNGSTFNLTQLNDAYFDRLRSLVQYANSKDIVVLITVHDGWTKTRFAGHPLNSALGGSLTANSQYVELADYNNEMPTTFNSSWTRQQKHQYYLERFCDRLIQATSDQPNVIYEMFNEGEWYNQTNLDNFQRHFLNFFKARTPRVTMVNKDSFRSVANCDSVSLHQPNWSSSTVATDSFGTYAPKFSGSPAKPYYFSEPVPEYRGDSSLHTALTRLMWGTVCAGAGFVVQNDCSFGWDPNTSMASQSANREAVYNLEGHCARFFNQSGVTLAGMSPQGSLASTGVCLARAGYEYVVYSQSSSFTVNLAGTSGTLVCRFYNPRNGTFQSAFYRSAGGTQSFTAPDSNDWVLHIVNYNDDTQPPTVPTNVQATAQSSSSINVTWTASTDNVGVAGYKVFRDGSQVGTSTGTNFIDTGLQAQTTYSYTVSAYDLAGNNSAVSSPPAQAITQTPSPVLMQDDFTTNPFTAPARWDVYYSDWTTLSSGSVLWSSSGGQSGGYVYRERTGHRMIVWTGAFTSAGWDAARLRFYTKNVSGGTIDAEVKRNGVWTKAGATVADNAAWTQETRDLTGTITGVRFKLYLTSGDYIARRLDSVIVEGVDNTAPNPGTASSPAYGSGDSITVGFAGAGDSGGSAFKWTWLWYKKGENGTWQSSGLYSSATSGSFVFDAAHGLSGDGVYYFTLHAEDNSGNTSIHPSLKGNGDCGTLYDTTPPDTPTVTDDGAYITATGEIHASWAANDLTSGVTAYQYAVSTMKEESGIIQGGGWQTVGAQTQATRTGVSLVPGQVYYILTRARNGVGLWSDAGASDGVTVVWNANAGIDLAAAKSRPDHTAVGLQNQTVSALFGDCFYIQSANRAIGLKVIPMEMPAGIAVGSLLDIGGIVQTSGGERRITDATCLVR